MYCTNCGAEIADGINFCPYCGTALNSATALTAAASSITPANEYQVILISKGTCDTLTLKNLLSDVFSYSSAEASSLLNNMPVQIAQNLNEEEASVIAQMFCEYGAEITVLDEKMTYVDLSENASSSLFNFDGSLITKAAAIIGALTIANKVTSFRTIRKPSLLERIFRPLFTPKPPRRYVPVQRHEPTRYVKPKPVYRNTMERQQRPVTGHHGGPNGRMKGHLPH